MLLLKTAFSFLRFLFYRNNPCKSTSVQGTAPFSGRRKRAGRLHLIQGELAPALDAVVDLDSQGELLILVHLAEVQPGQRGDAPQPLAQGVFVLPQLLGEQMQVASALHKPEQRLGQTAVFPGVVVEDRLEVPISP